MEGESRGGAIRPLPRLTDEKALARVTPVAPQNDPKTGRRSRPPRGRPSSGASLCDLAQMGKQPEAKIHLIHRQWQQFG